MKREGPSNPGHPISGGNTLLGSGLGTIHVAHRPAEDITPRGEGHRSGYKRDALPPGGPPASRGGRRRNW